MAKWKKGGLGLNVENEPNPEMSYNFSATGRFNYRGFQVDAQGNATAQAVQGAHLRSSADVQSEEEKLSAAAGASDFESLTALAEKAVKATDMHLLGALGSGQNGTVHKALYLPELDIVALKAVNVYDNNKRRQMVHELEAFTRTRASHVVKLVGCYTDPKAGTLTMALEYMNRGSLKQVVDTYGAIKEPVLRGIAKDILHGMRSLHKRKQLHRDIKPDNILLNNQGKAKISDFGLVKELAGTSQELASTFVGTTLYLSPERLRGEDYSFPADIWAVGIILVFCAMGKLPPEFKQDYWAMVANVGKAKESNVKLDPASFSAPLCDFVSKCVALNPEHRWTAEQLMQHPWIQTQQDVVWPFAEATEEDYKTMRDVNQIVIKQLFGSGLERYTRSLFQMARFNKIGSQLSIPQREVMADFHEQFQELYPDLWASTGL